MKQIVNIYDIAKMTGVSPSTVSNVINGRDNKVSQKTKQRVLECLESTGYRMNMVARNLVTGKSMLVGICLPLLEEGATQFDLLENNPFYHEFIDGAQKALLEGGCECIVRGMDDNFKYLQWIQNRSLDGLIDLGNLSVSLNDQLKKIEVPAVLVDNYSTDVGDCGVVLSDDFAGGYAAAKHLLELGHRKIAFVCNKTAFIGVDYERYRGYKAALAEYGVNEEFIYKIYLNYASGLELGHNIVDADIPVTAITCTADIAAIGILRGIEERGKNVPEDYSVVGYDDIKVLGRIEFGLTTIRQKIAKKSSVCAEMLLESMRDPQNRNNKKAVIEPEIVIRNTTRSIK